MANQFTADQVEAALLQLLSDAFGATPVRALTDSDVNEMGDLVVDTPCVLLRLEDEVEDSSGDHLKINYEAQQAWLVIVGARNLRSVAAERTSAYGMIETAKEALAGAKLALDNGSFSYPIELSRASLLQFDKNGTFYALAVMVPGNAQFTSKG